MTSVHEFDRKLIEIRNDTTIQEIVESYAITVGTPGQALSNSGSIKEP